MLKSYLTVQTKYYQLQCSIRIHKNLLEIATKSFYNERKENKLGWEYDG